MKTSESLEKHFPELTPYISKDPTDNWYKQLTRTICNIFVIGDALASQAERHANTSLETDPV